MEAREGVPVFDPGSPVGTPLSQDTPASLRSRSCLPEPLCSPISTDGSPFPHGTSFSHGSPMGQMPSSSPSPANKKYVGVSSNARNNIYLKVLMNSPYHKSYTPLSATPGFSPAYQTPARTVTDKHESPGWGVTSTPQGTKPPGSGRKLVTPKNIITNPFESGTDDLHLPTYMSPGFFTVASTPASEEKKLFRWSIEHIAELRPADIEEMPSHQTHTATLDKETEERAQRAIEQFFANNLIVPSPWSDPKKAKKKNILPATPASQGSGSKQVEEMIAELQGSIQKSLNKQGTADASCQTTLSLPVNFDIQKVLGAYMSQDSNTDEGNQQDMLSTSSLRRKLFFHGDTSSQAPSPVKGGNQDNHCEPCSPLFAKQIQPNWDRATPLRNTPTFSSSPIKSACTPQLHRQSSDSKFLSSPELSPIVHGNITDTGKKSKSRSSGMFQVHNEDFDMSPVRDFRTSNTGRDSPMSPIPFHGISPDNQDEDFRPKFEDSPGFSPIRPPKTPIRKILRRSQEESYIQNECFSEDEGESVTPVSTNPKISSNSLTPVDSISPIRLSPTQRLSGTILKSHSCTDLKHTMDFEPAPSPRDNILTSSLCDTRDFSASVDFSDDTHHRTSLSNQDTGYQTASLQSTNQESVSLHTNLTNQFGSLPFNVTSQDTSQMLTNQEKPPILNLTHHFSIIANQKEDEIKLGSDTANQKSASLFPKQKFLFMDDDIDTDYTPKNSVATKQIFGDSALPDDFSLSQSQMEMDVKASEIDSVDTHEEEVLSRARQALALANSMYPQEEKQDVKSGILRDRIDSLSEKSTDHKPSASEIAFSIIQRAGEDLARFTSFKSTKNTEIPMEGLHGNS